MRISDWSSDVCSSDLDSGRAGARRVQAIGLVLFNIVQCDAQVSEIGLGLRVAGIGKTRAAGAEFPVYAGTGPPPAAVETLVAEIEIITQRAVNVKPLPGHRQVIARLHRRPEPQTGQTGRAPCEERGCQ